MRRKRKKTPAEKRRSARLGALVYVLATIAALTGSIATDSCGGERYRRGSLMTMVSGDEGYGRTRLSMCGFVRGVTPGAVDVVPCQVWNLAPFTLLGVFAGGWLVLDLFNLNLRRRD